MDESRNSSTEEPWEILACAMAPGCSDSSCVIHERSPRTGIIVFALWKGSDEAAPVGEQGPMVPGGLFDEMGIGLRKFGCADTISIVPAFRSPLLTPKSNVRSLTVESVRRPSGVTGHPQHVCISSKSSNT